MLERCLESGGHEDDATLLAVRLTPATANVFARRLPALVRNLKPLRAELRAWLQQLHLHVSVINDVLLACGEAGTNAIEHPYSGEATGDVALEAWLSGDKLRVTVRDFGVWRRAALPGD